MAGAILISCNENNTAPTELENKLYLSVKNENGNVLEDVDLHFFCNSWVGATYPKKQTSLLSESSILEVSMGQNFPNPFMLSTLFPLWLEDSCLVSLRILDRSDSTRIVKTISHEIFGPGSYQITWDGTNDSGRYVPNNIYRYQLIANDQRETSNLFVNVIFPEHLKSNNTIPLSTSDSEGSMEVEYDIFPIGIETLWTDPNGYDLGKIEIPDSISLMFLKDGYSPLVKNVAIKKDEPLELTVVLERD